MSTSRPLPKPGQLTKMSKQTCVVGHRAIEWLLLAGLLICTALAAPLRAEQDKIRTAFRVKYVTADAVYLEGGSSVGLSPGQRLTVKHKESETDAEGGKDVAEIELESVASTSAAGKILSPPSCLRKMWKSSRSSSPRRRSGNTRKW